MSSIIKNSNALAEIIRNRKLILDLAVTDFKNKYSASFFGSIWAFTQPIVTTAIYCFVFQFGFRQGAGVQDAGYPFLLYLIAGIIPWFFFDEAWKNATNCLVEYSYLVKKVVFRIDVLPIVKIISSFFVHAFFIVVALVLYVAFGKLPDVKFLQLFYYLFCMFLLILALSYLTAAVTPFFPDLAQIIGILLQLGMWTIPIMYEESMITTAGSWGPKVMMILKLNPMYYIVTGYRDSFMHGQWFFERGAITIYFWAVAIILFVVGFRAFQKLKVHFADVL